MAAFRLLFGEGFLLPGVEEAGKGEEEPGAPGGGGLRLGAPRGQASWGARHTAQVRLP